MESHNIVKLYLPKETVTAFLHKKVIFPDFQELSIISCFDNDLSSQN